MSSFDDAIRQHLDLKRRRGADPREVAELEREVLGADQFAPSADDRSGRERHRAPREPGLGLHAIDWDDDEQIQARRSRISQDTVEVDMAAVIGSPRIEAGAAAEDLRAYDWNTDLSRADIADPASDFAWETPRRVHLRGAA